MKKIKMIILFFLMVGAFIYTGESYIDYYNTFKDNYFSFTINDSNEQDSEATLREILKAANKNNIELFAEGHENIVINDSKTKKIMPKETYYVTSPEVKEMLEKKDYILAGTHRTLFLGDCLYEYADLYKLKDLKSIKEFCCIYSDERDLTQFQLDMNESNSAVEFIDISKATPEKIKVVCLWCLVAIVYLLLTAYELAFERKKAAIKMSFGEKHATLIVKNIMLDSAVILSEFAILILLLNIFTHTFFMWEAELSIVILMIALSIVVYLIYFKTDIHKAFSGYKSTKILTGFNYIVKFVSGLLAIILFSLNIGVIVKGVDKYKEREFFKDYINYDYLGLWTEDSYNGMKEIDLRLKFYCENFDNAVLQTTFQDTKMTEPIGDKQYPALYLNRNAKSNLTNEMKNIITQEKVYFLYPEDISQKDAEKYSRDNAEIVGWMNAEENKYKFDYETHIYHGDFKTVTTNLSNEIFFSQTERNPVIIFNNLNDGKITDFDKGDINITRLNSNGQIMYDMSKLDIEKWMKDNNLNDNDVGFYRMNVYQHYLSEWNLLKSGTIINSILSAFIILFQIFIVKTIVMLEYSTNSKKLAIKSFLGYSRVEKFIRLWLSGIAVIVIGTVAAIIMKIVFGTLETQAILISTALLLIIEITVNFFYTSKLEKNSINKLIKGGNM